METDILDSLNDIGYEGPLSDEAAFTAALAAGPKSLELTKLVHILAAELKELLHLEETVSMMNSPDESNTFLMELSSFLKELGCPYTKLVTGHMSSRLQCTEDCILLLEYLVSELMAARMVRHDRPQTGPNMEIVVQESPTARDLKNILISLKFNKPPPGITAEVLFAKLETKLKDTIQKEGDNLVGKPLYNKALTEKQWRELETAFAEMTKEYKLRRETLITRLECTIRSFEWSDRLKSKKDAILSVSRPAISSLSPRPGVTLSQLLAARSSMLEDKRKKDAESHVRGIVIGPVPDRGGRPSEAQPPPPEMPSWQQRTPGQQGGGRGGPRGGRGGGGGGRGGGGRVQGGYNQGGGGGESRPQSNSSGYQQQNQRFQSYQTYEVPPGGYQNQTTGYNHNRGGYQQGGGCGGGYNQNQDNGYQGGYNKNQGGGYQGGYNQNQGGYGQRGGGYNQGYGSGGGGGGYQGGYQNEHDDRDRPARGRSNYNRGGRR